MGSYPKLKRKKRNKKILGDGTYRPVKTRPQQWVSDQLSPSQCSVWVFLSLSGSIVNELELNVDCSITPTHPHTKKKKGKTEIPIFLELCGTVLGIRISQRPELAALKKTAGVLRLTETAIWLFYVASSTEPES